MTKILLDSANIDEIKEIKDLGLLEGVTTNPNIIRMGFEKNVYQGDFLDYAKNLLEVTEDKPVFFQTMALKEKDIIKQAIYIYNQLSKYGNPVIKVPISTKCNENEGNYDGFRAIKELSKDNIPTLATAVVNPTQAYLASVAGAEYSAFILRKFDEYIAKELDIDLGLTDFFTDDKVKEITYGKIEGRKDFLSGLGNLKKAKNIFKEHSLDTKLLVAGIRNSVQFSEVLEQKVDYMTIPFPIFPLLFSHSATTSFVTDTRDLAAKQYREFLYNNK
tara:strand:+ start:1457 stop:2281 length:825 start_codon:yes stop_codon:yes gene_type:complete